MKQILNSPGKILLLLLAILTGVDNQDLQAQKISRDLNPILMVNQAGYVPNSIKTTVTRGKRNGKFEVINLKTQKIVFTGSFKPDSGDFGDYSLGDFSAVTAEGYYYIKSDTLRSYPFEISGSAYNPEMDLIVKYFSLQRCGSSTTGYLSPCHLDDGVRMDNGKHQDVSGGWHDASDLRKWVGATVYGMIGLSKTYELQSGSINNRSKILEELRWGNQYFLKMQEPQGYIMNFVGGDVKKHSDSNRWTDNEIGKEGGELNFVNPTAGKSTSEMLLFGPKDDRVIETNPLDLGGQYIFVTAEALMARITKDDPDYSEKCLQAASKGFRWCESQSHDKDTRVIGASMQAAIEMYKTTKEAHYMDFAIAQAESLKMLQENNIENGISGFFKTSEIDDEPFKNIWEGSLGFISLCDMIQMFPKQSKVPEWKKMVAGYANQYLMYFTEKNSFGIVPFGLYTKRDPGGNRKAGKYWYRYFMQPELDWWVGINANVASAGIGLIKASEVLNDPKLKAFAQKQLDWITGVNPFNSSTIVGVGYNHPPHFGGSTFLPLTPVIPGAVLNGLGGDHEDQAMIGDGDWQISEYWTPMVSYTLWLMAEISTNE